MYGTMNIKLYCYTVLICTYNKYIVSYNPLHIPFIYYLFVILQFLNYV